MHLHIVLPEQPTDDQIRKAIEMIGHYAGQEQMMRVAGGLRSSAAVPAVVTPPAVVVPPPPAANGLSGVDAITASSFTGANGVTVELDKNGLPWDERIHSGSKNVNKDGTWKAKKNCPDLLTNTVTAELRNALANRTYMPGGAAPAAKVDNAPFPAAVVPPTVVPAVATPPAVHVEAATGDVTTFPQLMQKVAPLLGQKKLTQAQLQECAVSLNLAAFSVLGTRPDLIAAADAYLSMVATA